jgi:hypothetical protein
VPPRQRINGGLVAPAFDQDRRACIGVERQFARGRRDERWARTRGVSFTRRPMCSVHEGYMPELRTHSAATNSVKMV